MNIQPVSNTPAPGYPDKYAEESRQALAAAQPRRWIAAPLAAGLAATVALGLSGCGEAFVTGGVPVQTPTQVTTGGTPFSTEYFNEITTARPLLAGTIPLFEFGEGTGAFGCVSVTAPVFMSEEEAFAILSTEFAEAGIMIRRNSKIQQAILPITDRYSFANDDPLQTKKGALIPDGTLNDMPVEFVSRADVDAWEREDYTMRISVDEFNMKEAAQTLAENNPGLIVFYDPVTAWMDEIYEERWEMKYDGAHTEADARAESEQLLRQQVQAFLQWLQEEGAR